MWSLEVQDAVEKRFKRFEKKWQHEMTNVMANLQELVEALNDGVRPEQLKQLRFVRSEPQGLLAVDETGLNKGTKPVPFRLYVYPDESVQVLHLITLGNKDMQKDDLDEAQTFVIGLLRGKQQPTAVVQRKVDGSHAAPVKDGSGGN